MKVQYKILFPLFFCGILLVSGCLNKEIAPEKYCEKNEDCLTSCGTPVGHGECFNKNYVNSFNLFGVVTSPLDGACCACQISSDVVECMCQKNVCNGIQIE